MTVVKQIRVNNLFCQCFLPRSALLFEMDSGKRMQGSRTLMKVRLESVCQCISHRDMGERSFVHLFYWEKMVNIQLLHICSKMQEKISLMGGRLDATSILQIHPLINCTDSGFKWPESSNHDESAFIRDVLA